MTTITERDVERFTNGDCHYLARALAIKTRWPIATFEHRGMPALHAFVLLPDSRVLDVQGLCEQKEFKKRWSTNLPITTNTWDSLKSYFGSPEFGHYTYQRAHAVADHLLLDLQ